MTAPQPSRNARVMTLRFVPGGPEPMTNGFGNFNPSTVVASVGMTDSLLTSRPFYQFRAIHAMILSASLSNAVTAISRCSSRVSSILLWLMPCKLCTNIMIVGTPARATSAASCSGPEAIDAVSLRSREWLHRKDQQVPCEIKLVRCSKSAPTQDRHLLLSQIFRSLLWPHLTFFAKRPHRDGVDLK